jgi:hypothetical protein
MRCRNVWREGVHADGLLGPLKAHHTILLVLEPCPGKNSPRALVRLRGDGQDPGQPEPRERPTTDSDDPFCGEPASLVGLCYRKTDLDVALERAQPDVADDRAVSLVLYRENVGSEPRISRRLELSNQELKSFLGLDLVGVHLAREPLSIRGLSAQNVCRSRVLDREGSQDEPFRLYPELCRLASQLLTFPWPLNAKVNVQGKLARAWPASDFGFCEGPPQPSAGQVGLAGSSKR